MADISDEVTDLNVYGAELIDGGLIEWNNQTGPPRTVAGAYHLRLERNDFVDD